MENNQMGNSGQESRESQEAQNRQGNNRTDYNQNDPNQRNAAKFEQDSDDFSRSEDNLDGESNMSTGGESSGTPYQGPGKSNLSDDMNLGRDQSREDARMNDRGRSQATNSEEDMDDWNSRNL